MTFAMGFPDVCPSPNMRTSWISRHRARVLGLGTDDDFSLLASACRGHLVGVCLHDVSVYAVALAVVVVVRRLFIFLR